MAWKPIVIDDSIANTASGGAARIPEGDYLLQIMRVQTCPEAYMNDPQNDNKNPYLRVVFAIKDGPISSGSYSEVYSFAPKALFRLGALLLQAGIPQANIDRLKGYPLPTFASFVELAQKLEGAIG